MVKECPVCGLRFEGAANGRYCSSRCKQIAYRRRKKIYEQAGRGHDGLGELDRLAWALRNTAAELAVLSRESSPAVAVVCNRLNGAICDALWAEGML